MELMEEMGMKKSFPAHLLRLLLDPRVSRQKKLAFPLVIAAYWILPDLLPFLPLDDLLITALVTYWFTRSAAKDTGESLNGQEPGSRKDGRKYVDVEASVVDDDEA